MGPASVSGLRTDQSTLMEYHGMPLATCRYPEGNAAS